MSLGHAPTRLLPYLPGPLASCCTYAASKSSATMVGNVSVYSRCSRLAMHRVRPTSGVGEVEGRVLPLNHPIQWEESGVEMEVVPSGPSSEQQARDDHLLAECHPSVELRWSRIHSRGLFVTRPIPKGTALIHFQSVHYVTPLTALYTLGNQTVQTSILPRYLHQCGGLMQFPLAPSPLHLVNHGCDPTIRCASVDPGATSWYNLVVRASWLNQEPASSSSAPAASRSKDWSDANTFVAARDLAAGEELLLDYRLQLAPRYNTEFKRLMSEEPACRCGSPKCRGEIYPTEFIENLRLVDRITELSPEVYHDEAVMISLVRNRTVMLNYLANHHRELIDPELVRESHQRARFLENPKEFIRMAASAVPPATGEEPRAPPATPRRDLATNYVIPRRLRKRAVVSELKTVLDRLAAVLPQKVQ